MSQTINRFSWFAAFFLTAATAFPANEAVVPEKHRQFFESYCTECHNADKQKGKLRLDNVSLKLDSVENAERWQKILNQINSGEMPPDDSKQPEKRAKTEFLDSVANTLVVARKTLSDQHGNITMRRLNQREYKNTIRELLGVEVDVHDLPKDGGSGAFDTVGAALFMSSDQFEQYLVLGRRAIDDSFARALGVSAQSKESAPRTITERREVELHANAKAGGTYNGYYKGGYNVAKAYLDSDRSKPPSAFGKGIADEVEAKFRVKVFEEHGPSFERYLNDPLTQKGAYLTIYSVNIEEVITLPPDQPSGWLKTKHEVEKVESGRYKLRFRIGAVKGTPQERHFVDLGSRAPGTEEFSLMHTFQISGTIDEPQIIELPVNITGSGPRTFVLREKRDVKLDFDLYTAARKTTGVGPESALWIDWVEWEGPLAEPDPPAIAELFVAQNPETPEAQTARALLERFAVRAFRDLKPEPAYMNRLVELFEVRRKAGDSFRDALKEPMGVVLASPGFLYLAEPSSGPTRRHLTQREFATRLAYFLWSAPPDAELLALSQTGDLSKPEILSKQLDRMIEDPRSSAFVKAFVHQWLGLDRLDFFQFDTKVHRTFDESTKAAARTEVIETFASLLQKRESLSQLLKSDFVVINGLLANFYGIPDVSGDDFRPVKLAPNSPRGGLLGMAAIHAMGSNGKDSSPVERGAWVLRKILHEPPPPAPPNVPQLSRLEGKLLTTHERLMAHQEQPQCASCHRKIDPIGFGLENFDAVGKWRTEDGYEKKGVGKKTWTIEPASAFHNGPAFKDYFELRDLIAAKPERIARGLTEALIEYGLGRPFGFSDEDLAVRILEQSQNQNFEVRAFLQALVSSPDFQMK
ncbi:MAG: DUF1592 domain-containing protein [Proteobacteria bacterium]|nr:DUF1592 domain-containing protein [Pseudomonadota bacterium]